MGRFFSVPNHFGPPKASSKMVTGETRSVVYSKPILGEFYGQMWKPSCSRNTSKTVIIIAMIPDEAIHSYTYYVKCIMIRYSWGALYIGKLTTQV